MLVAVTDVGSATRILFDGGTFDHMFGQSVKHLVTNVVSVPPKYFRTASSIMTLDKKGDLPHRYGVFKWGYINPYLDTTLISEGKQIEDEGWEFKSSRAGKEVTAQFTDESGEAQTAVFWATKTGRLYYMPVRIKLK